VVPRVEQAHDAAAGPISTLPKSADRALVAHSSLHAKCGALLP
jgi:hypothetical protein